MKDKSILATLRDILNHGTQVSDIKKVVPLFIPVSFIESGNWPGPYEILNNTDFVLTWVILTKKQTMLYVNKDCEIQWNNQKFEWKDIAYKNLLKSSERQLWTHEKRRQDNSILFVVIMSEDGIGTSKLMLGEKWKVIFPEGYKVALPERSCGIVFSSRLTEQEEREILELVENCYNNGTSPISSRVFTPYELEKKICPTTAST